MKKRRSRRAENDLEIVTDEITGWNAWGALKIENVFNALRSIFYGVETLKVEET